MASLFTTSSKVKVKQPFGNRVEVPFYLQFVPGIVIDAVTHSSTKYGFGVEKNTNSIMAYPHIFDGVPKRRRDVGEEDRYFPLLRGMYEVPSIGDPVLLCNIGGHRYYLGPLNKSTKNSPNWNLDDMYQPEIDLSGTRPSENQTGGQTSGLNFIKNGGIKRLSKRLIPELDNNNVYHETHGDIHIEGRHGNSIRVGSRKSDPYMILSNGRAYGSDSETIFDGSLISITQNGSLSQHFNQTIQTEAPEELDEKGRALPREILKETFGFTLASDDVGYEENPPTRFMGSLVSSVNGNIDINDEIYNYSDHQIIISSNRLTLNTKLDDMYLSSNKDIHIGTKRHLTMSTNKNLIIESDKTYLGDPNKKTMDNMVLGKKLQEALRGIVDMIKTLQITTQLGPQSPLPSPSEQSVTSLIDSILSTKHFIEE